MKGYITKYYNSDNLCYDSKVFRNKRDALKKNGAKTISIIVSNWEDIYFGDNFKGWCTDKVIATYSK